MLSDYLGRLITDLSTEVVTINNSIKSSVLLLTAYIGATVAAIYVFYFVGMVVSLAASSVLDADKSYIAIEFAWYGAEAVLLVFVGNIVVGSIKSAINGDKYDKEER